MLDYFKEIKLINHLIKSDLNIYLIIMISISISSIIFYYSRLKQIKFLTSSKQKKKKKKKVIKNRKSLFNSFKEKLNIVLLVRNKESKADMMFNLFLIGLFTIFINFLILDSLPLAISIPSIIFLFTHKILDMLVIDFDSVVRKNFSILINHMVKVFSKTNDLGVVLYESSKEMDEPLRSLILALSREIITNNNEKRLINFIEKTENLWLHAFIFTLINYKENSSKEDVIANLLELGNMIDERNKITEKMVADRKPVVIINYMLLLVGIVIFIGNLILNPIMKTFLFTPIGMVCLILGISAIFSTVIINMKLVKQ